MTWQTMTMGLLDKLMFWKEETSEVEFDVKGCFTLPSDPENIDPGPAADDVTAQVDGKVTKPDC